MIDADRVRDYRHLTQKCRRHVATIEKRIRHLEGRVASSDRDLTYDKQEITALKWALEYVSAHREPAVVWQPGRKAAPVGGRVAADF
jgi:hypothetical protein